MVKGNRRGARNMFHRKNRGGSVSTPAVDLLRTTSWGRAPCVEDAQQPDLVARDRPHRLFLMSNDRIGSTKGVPQIPSDAKKTPVRASRSPTRAPGAARAGKTCSATQCPPFMTVAQATAYLPTPGGACARWPSRQGGAAGGSCRQSLPRTDHPAEAGEDVDERGRLGPEVEERLPLKRSVRGLAGRRQGGNSAQPKLPDRD